MSQNRHGILWPIFLVHLILCGALILPACSSIDLPTIEESNATIERLKPAIESSDRSINALGGKLALTHHFMIRARRSLFSSTLSSVAHHRSDDARIRFNGNKPWMQKEESIFGIKYSNALNIDGGSVAINLSELRIESFHNNLIDVRIAMKGEGSISLSGTYTGIPASASPGVEAEVHDDIQLFLASTDSGSIVLAPVPKKVNVMLQFTVSLLGWKLPWSESYPMQISDLIKPMVLPLNFSSMVQLPMPATSPKEKYSYKPVRLRLFDIAFDADADVLDWRSNFDLQK